jgi:2-aminoadipate transaminase
MLGVSALPWVATEPRLGILNAEVSEMTAAGVDRFQELLSQRAAFGPRAAIGGRTGITYNFGAGNPDPGSFPYQGLVQAMSDVMEVDGADALSYGSFYGYQGLREWVCHKLKVFENLDTTPDNILITNGSGDALGLVIQTFVDVGDPVICEAPTFSGTLQTLRRNGADLYGVEVDDEGMRTDRLADRLEQIVREGRKPKLIYTIDTFHNPAGPTLTEQRRREVLELARTYNVVVLEDDAYGELRFEGTAVPSLFELDDAGLVARSGTLSKILGAGTRVGWVIAPPSMIGYASAFNFGGSVSPLTSRVCTFYMRGALETHVAELRQIYKDKRDAMIETLEQELAGTDFTCSRPEGGFFLWIKLPTGTSQATLARLAAEQKVGYVAGPAFMPNGGGEEYIRLAYSYETPEEIREGTRLLCQSILAARA